mgnify:CR=1 FL=1
MNQADINRLVEEIAGLREDVRMLMHRLNALHVGSALPADATAAHLAREAAKLRGFFWVDEFAAVIGRHRQFVSDRCSSRVIKTLKGGKPYRIPLDEANRWNSSD